jgi:hypothetical protein
MENDFELKNGGSVEIPRSLRNDAEAETRVIALNRVDSRIHLILCVGFPFMKLRKMVEEDLISGRQ